MKKAGRGDESPDRPSTQFPTSHYSTRDHDTTNWNTHENAATGRGSNRGAASSMWACPRGNSHTSPVPSTHWWWFHYWFLVLATGMSGCSVSIAVASLAVHPSPPIHRNNIPRRRAGNDRVAGPGVDREVKRSRFRRRDDGRWEAIAPT
jgi:hypothetical protein